MASTLFRRDRQELARLFRSIQNPSDVVALFGRLATGHNYSSTGDEFRPCLEQALEVPGASEDVHGLFFAISRWAIQALEDSGPGAWPAEVVAWRRGTGAQRVSYTAAQCRSLLANALLLNVNDTVADLKTPDKEGGLNLASMLMSTRPIAAQKLACLLRYFSAARTLEGTQDDQREVVFERRAPAAGLQDLDDFKQWALSAGAQLPCAPGRFQLHGAGMEAIGDADAFVNFANPDFGYGHFIPSCTQEEIMQMCCPEFNIGMLHQGCMTDQEVVTAHGVRRYSDYTGYAAGFKYAGAWQGQADVQTILTMDATTKRHYDEVMVLRDIRKAYLCFSGCRIVSTGRWGCGAFGGCPAHKFAQQVVAACLAGCEFRFSTLGTPDGCDAVLALLAETQPSAAQLLVATLSASAAARGRRDFVESLAAILRERAKAPGSRPLSPEDVGRWQALLQRMRCLESGDPSLEPVQLADWLYLGGAQGWSTTWLLEKGITRVVNATAVDLRYSLPSSIEVLEVKAVDTEDYDLFAHWSDVFKFVDGRGDGSVLIHCQQGINRSAAFAVAALCVCEKRPFLQVFRQSLARRPGILRNRGFQRQLLEFVHGQGHLLEDADVIAEVDAYDRMMKAVFGLFAERGVADFNLFQRALEKIGEGSAAEAHWDSMGTYTLAQRDAASIELWFRSDSQAAALLKCLRALVGDDTMQAFPTAGDWI